MPGHLSSDSADQGYHQFEHQIGDLKVKVNDSVGPNGDTIGELTLDPGAGELDATDSAELVRMDLWHYGGLVNEAGTIDTIKPGSMRFETQVAVNNAILPGLESASSSSDVEQLGGGGNVLGRDFQRDAENNLYRGDYTVDLPASDDTDNNDGGGDTNFLYRQSTHFREEFGQGPVFYDNDDLVIRGRVSKIDGGNRAARGETFVKLSWDVHENSMQPRGAGF